MLLCLARLVDGDQVSPFSEHTRDSKGSKLRVNGHWRLRAEH